MLMRSSGNPQAPRRVRQLWHDSRRNAPALGCQSCPEKDVCGGVYVAAPYFDCLTYCCNRPGSCKSVCRNNVHFAKRVWEIEGFDLKNLPKNSPLERPNLPMVVPIIYHASSRVGILTPGTAALPLSVTFGKRAGEAKVGSAVSLRAAYRLAPDTNVILTGIGEDVPIERWWGVGVQKRIIVIKAMIRARIGLVTTPNFSLTINVPRWDDLHAIKRIGHVYSELVGEGMPAALHVNGRTDWDFVRWTQFIVDHREVTHVAYEFTTGSRWGGRRIQHAAWLCTLAKNVGRPLHLIVRGGHELMEQFLGVFDQVTVLEADSFMWTMKRKEAILGNNSNIRWRAAPTEKDAPLDQLMTKNIEANKANIESRLRVIMGKHRIGTA